MKDLLALAKLLVASATFVNGVLKFNIEFNVTGSVDIRDPEDNYILFFVAPVVDATDPAP